MVDFSGSVIVSVDVAKELIRKGYSVSICSFRILDEIHKILTSFGIEVILIDDGSQRQGLKFDLLWGHHPVIINRLLDLGFQFKHLIFSSLSPYEPLEFPPVYIQLFDFVLANSWETQERLRDFGIGNSFVFPNASPVEYLSSGRLIIKELRKILVVSNHLVPEVIRARDSLILNGFQVDILGFGHNHKMVSPDLLLNYDAIVTIGRTVPLALALGIPVYCYDHFGGDGWILLKNFEINSKYNFSGRPNQRKISGDLIFEEIVSSYSEALKDLPRLRSLVETNYNFSKIVSFFLSQLKEKLSYKSINDVDKSLRSEILSSRAFSRLLTTSYQLKNELFKISEELGATSKELSKRNNLLIEIQQSKSWLVTSPLRSIYSFIRKLK